MIPGLLSEKIVVSIDIDLINSLMLKNFMTTPYSLEKKLYQLIITRLDGEDISSGCYQETIFELVRKGIGGFIIFGGKKAEVKCFIDKIQSISEIPLFIASDIERGVGQQIQNTTVFPCQMAMAAAIDKNRPEDVTILENVIKAIAYEARDIGINMPLIPVLDVNQNPDNPIICTRAFSDNPEDVAWFGSEYIRTLESTGIISCAKHFPGHGDTSTDSHILLPIINKSYENLMNMDIMPFREAIHAGTSGIMIGHLSIPAIDSKPASLSKKIITDILRKDLGFEGLILTDALIMNALKDIENVPAQSMKAGADVLLHPADPDLTFKGLMSAVESEEITEEQIATAINRILKIKVRLKNIERHEIDYQRHEILSSQVTAKSISLFKNTPGLLPFSDQNKVHVIFAGDEQFFQTSPLKSYFKKVSTINGTKYNENYPSPIPLPQGEGARGRVKDVFSEQIVLFAVFTSVAAWKGSSGIGEDERNRMNELIRKAKHSIVVSFGSPYVLRHFKGADVLIAAYEATDRAQRAVLNCLEGRMDFKGRLPVKLNILEE
jgi:beta-glucosidase-like glycosyl hydrolase